MREKLLEAVDLFEEVMIFGTETCYSKHGYSNMERVFS